MFKHSIKRPLAGACIFGLGAFILNAQTNLTLESKSEVSASATNVSPTEASYHPFTIAAEVGTSGVGGWIGWRFSGLLGVHAGMDYFNWTGSQKIEDITYGVKFQPLNESVALDLYPWKRHSFHVSLGIMVDQSELTGRVAGAYALNGNIYTGTLDLNIRPQPVNPYVSIGGNLFYFDHAHHWAVFGELGAAYLGTPRVSLMASDPTASFAVANEKNKIENSIRGFPIWPILKLGLNYSF